MNSIEIEKVLRRNIGDCFGGVYPSNQIPPLKIGFCYVFNSMCQCNPGEHWIGLYATERNHVELFDSYGLGPRTYQFLPLPLRIKYNKVALQGPTSTSCGHFTCAFLVHRIAGVSMEEFLQMFTTDYDYNDWLVRDYIDSI